MSERFDWSSRGNSQMDQQSMDLRSGLSTKLAKFSVGLTLQKVPQKAVDNAKIAILDCLGVAVLAASQEIGEKLVRFAGKNAAPGSCTIWGTPLRSNMRDAVLLNGTLAHALDYDDRNHASTYTLAVSIAAAEEFDSSGAKALEAFVVGREVRAALDGLFSKRSSGIGPGAKGWHSNGILGPIASTCAASKVLGLDVDQTSAAIGLAAGSCGALTRDGGTMAKPFRVGHAAATGITCALLAAEGFTSDETALEGRYGLLEALGPVPEELLMGLGEHLGDKFELERDIKIKPFASCTASHASVEAMLRLVEKHAVSAADVELIEADLKPYPLVRQNPKRGFEGRFSMPFCLANALVYRRLRPNDFSDRRLQEPAIVGLIDRCRHIADAPSLIVVLTNGSRLDEPLLVPSDLKGWDQTVTKFRDSVGILLTDVQQCTIIESVQAIQKLSSIRDITQALQQTKGN
ncbi:MAG: MmgE/PrpD family protein [Candidatus Binatia bacterium]